MSLNPEFVALLQNNDVPSASTICEVAESLKAPLNELQEIEAEIQRLDELMETMKMKRQRIQKIIDDHNIILSPARRLPPDVLHEIFFHCLPTHHNPVMKRSESPLLLTRICSSWRAIALSSPRIWSRVYIPLPGDPRFQTIAQSQMRLSSASAARDSLAFCDCDVTQYGDGLRDPAHALYRFPSLIHLIHIIQPAIRIHKTRNMTSSFTKCSISSGRFPIVGGT